MYVSFGGPIFLIAVGANLRYATNITVSGVDMDVVGLILMIAGVAILILSIIIALVNLMDRRDYAEGRTQRPPPHR